MFIYCDCKEQDTRHLLYECPHLDNLWTEISNIIEYRITWKEIVLGIESNDYFNQNQMISLIAYIIYRKFIFDRNNENNRSTNMRAFIKSELKYRLSGYSDRICQAQTKNLIQQVINIL